MECPPKMSANDGNMQSWGLRSDSLQATRHLMRATILEYLLTPPDVYPIL